ncbi:MAG: hypothetical protein KKF02_13950 [Proteobacteria bacterium]|nr:hypothetical protein [Pseudomonadota bacterium]
MSGRKKRIELIRKIQKPRGSKVIVYFTGDRQPFASQIAEDAVLPLYKHLLALKAVEPKMDKIDLFLYTRGGDVGVPWRIVTMLREFYSEISVLIPYKAYSAGTMVRLSFLGHNLDLF